MDEEFEYATFSTATIKKRFRKDGSFWWNQAEEVGCNFCSRMSDEDCVKFENKTRTIIEISPDYEIAGICAYHAKKVMILLKKKDEELEQRIT